MQYSNLNIYIDGASKGNPGAASVGVVICDDKKNIIKKFGKPIGEATNNIAEYTALLYGLQEAVILNAKHCNIYSDSELLVKQINGSYKVKDQNIRLLWGLAQHLIETLKVNIKYIPREENALADTLASNYVG